MHPEVRPGVRRALLRRFPYGVFFAAGDVAITVLAVLHHRRSPRRWPRTG
jgi:toxin ParE1/3/4